MEVSASTVVFIVFSALCHLCLLSHLNDPTWSSMVRVLALCRYWLCIFHGVSVPGITWQL